ncbi:MAG: carbamoyltransferase HypF [Mariprofundus sp.]|nr:carbamoyltransferase HypF [Mariprofundus sp.]
MQGIKIRVRGVVQGVGFRPFIANLADELGIKGQICNDAEGVLIDAWADQDVLERFIQTIQQSPPPLAQVQSIERAVLKEACASSFKIMCSVQGKTATAVAADAATCAACLADVNNPSDRHYQYPFTNCTHCGPRLSIIRAVPYDRSHTSMSDFEMCDACLAEYQNAKKRRFHAQPNACPDCGPRLLWLNEKGETLDVADALVEAVKLIKQGHIVAIKGIGGIHLACDAGSEVAVATLRQRKRRYHKPFALMARDAAQIQAYADISAHELSLLGSIEAPVVVLNMKQQCSIAASVAPAQVTLGFMLPYTPLHHLLMQQLDRPIVLTSGNISDEPQCIDNQDVQQRLHDVVDGYLLHNREIVNRLDDSVLRVMAGDVRMLRRARGYAPRALLLPQGFEQANAVLAMGGELKNTFCLINHGQAIMSPHMGDLEHAAVHDDYRHNLALYRQLYDFNPQTIAVDMHPNYFSTQWGKSLAGDEQCGLIEVQHHHAHIAACMAESGLDRDNKVLGIALDGLGMGLHGELWGGEFLQASYASCERIGSIQAVAMPGGAKAMYEPWRNTYAQLHAAGWQEMMQRFNRLDVIQHLSGKPLRNLDKMIEAGLNSPPASSTGRLFDAVAAALGLCTESAHFEGQAAMALEVLAMEHFEAEEQSAYPVELAYTTGIPILMWKPMWFALLEDLQHGISYSRVAARFHHALIVAVSNLAIQLAGAHQLAKVVLSGGVFQNKLLLEGVQKQLSQAGLQVLIALDYPLNDGGLSLGQAVVAAAQESS